MTTTTLACPKCGAGYATGTRFCSSCGTDVSGGRPAAVESATAVLDRDEILPILMEATLGDYDIYGMLGKGGMATVYLALDLALNRKVAIKVMHPQMLMGDDAIARFRREAQTAANLQHPHVIPIYAVKQTPKIVFFVMKYVEGRPLDSIIKDVGQLPVEMATGILSQVCGALHYAHKRGIVHRDIKPANIMIDEDGNAVVTDFGIAKVSEAKGLTMTGATVGTPAYMSPEQYEGKNIAGAADQYSLGVVAYEMLTGHPPFGGDSIMTIMKGHLMEAPPPIDAERAGLPPQIASTVMRMLEKRIDDRFPDLAAVSTALDAKVLPESHPARTQLMELAKTGAMLRPRMSVPLSPVPPGKKTPRSAPTVQAPVAATATAAALPPAPAPAPATGPAKPASAKAPAAPQRSSNVGVLIGGLVLAAALGGGGWYYVSKPAATQAAETVVAQASPPPPAPTGADSVSAPVAGPVTAEPSPSTVPPEASTPAPVVETPAPAPVVDKAAERRAADEKRARAATAERERRLADDRRKANDEADRLRQVNTERERLKLLAQSRQAPSEAERLRSATAASAVASPAPVAKAPEPKAPEPKPEARPEPPKADGGAGTGSGTLKIASAVEDASLFIDGVAKGSLGSAPRNVAVKAGMIRWKVSKAGCVDAEGTATIDPGQTTTIGRTKASPICP